MLWCQSESQKSFAPPAYQYDMASLASLDKCTFLSACSLKPITVLLPKVENKVRLYLIFISTVYNVEMCCIVNKINKSVCKIFSLLPPPPPCSRPIHAPALDALHSCPLHSLPSSGPVILRSCMHIHR
jgi:hypothetical protein